MDNAEKQSLAWARLEALRSHPPSSWDEGAVSEFHGIVTALEEAYALDLSSFRVPEVEMKPRTVGASRAPRSGRFPAQRQVSHRRHCDGQFVRRRMEAIVLYLQNLQGPPERQKFGF